MMDAGWTVRDLAELPMEAPQRNFDAMRKAL